MSTELSGESKHILFISLVVIKDLTKRGIYPDLIKYFISKGHHVTILSPVERREKSKAEVIHGEGYTNIRYKTLNNTKTNYIEKLVSTLIIDKLITKALKNKLVNKVDILVTATPPITLTNTIFYVKKTFGVKCYLLLKDIFPDNIADLDLISRSSLLFKIFKKKEKVLYKMCDYIGCMSPANLSYLIANHKDLDETRIEINPNTIDPIEVKKSIKIKNDIREKYDIDLDKKVFFYGGNLGKPQMIDFLITLIDSMQYDLNVHFFIIGTGTEYGKLEQWKKQYEPHNLTLLSFLPKAEYDKIIHLADVGIVLLDNRFKIPNFPNRILSYMENKLPVFLATDVNTDISPMAVENGFGLWAESGDLDACQKVINQFVSMSSNQLESMGVKGHSYLLDHFHISRTGDLILEKI